MQVFLLFCELTLLYFLSRWVSQSLFTLFLLLFRARPVAVSMILLLQFPGTVIHELAHLFTAEILRVPTGKLTLVPESIRDENIRSGSVTIAQSDPFRRYAIGLAPIFAGLLVLTSISYFLSQNIPNWIYWSLIYLLFAVSNSMFSSPEDLKGFWPFAVVFIAFATIFYFLGIRFELTGYTLELVTRILTTLTKSLGLVLGVNAILLVVSRSLMMVLLRIFRVRIL